MNKSTSTAINNQNSSSSFTLFVVLPWNEVCSLRNLPLEVTVQDLYCRLELEAGCPAYTYQLVGSDGKLLDGDEVIGLSNNVWDGYMVRIVPLDKWIPVYNDVLNGDVQWIISNIKANHHDDNEDDDDAQVEKMSNDEATRTTQAARDDDDDDDDDNGSVALYLSCWMGYGKLCAKLLNAGVDPNTVTPFGRSPMFPAIVKDNEVILKKLMSHGAKSSQRDFLGESPLEVGKRLMSRQCVNKIHSFHIKNLPHTHMQGNKDADVSRNSDLEMSNFQKSVRIQINPKRPQRKAQSAKITASSNANLMGRANENTDCSRLKKQITSTSNCTSSSTQHPAMMRSNTYTDGFAIKADTTKTQTQTRTHTHPQHHSSQTWSTPRSFKYFTDMDSSSNAASTPRSPSGAATIRVASPQSKRQTGPSVLWPSNRHQNKPRVKWIETVEYPEVQLSSTRSTFLHNTNFAYKTFTAPSFQTLSSGGSDMQSPRLSKNNAQIVENSRNNGHIVVSTGDSEILDDNTDIEGKDDENKHEKSADETNDVKDEECSGEFPDEKKDVMKPTRNIIWKSRKQMEIKRKVDMENQKAAQRRIQLLENKKRDQRKRDSFEQWLKKKRRQKLREENSDDSDQSSDDEEERKRGNIEAFNNWLKELDERSVKQTNPKSAISLHKRKTRAIHGLIGISNTSLKEGNKEVEDSSKHMNSYQNWLDKKANQNGNKPQLKDFDEREARQYLSTMRKNVLAEAVSFEEWMEHSQDRKTLTEIIAETKRRHSNEVDKHQKRSQSAKRNGLSFEKWKQDLEAKEAKRKIAELRLRRHTDKERQLRENDRVSSAISHNAWVQKKIEEEKEQGQQRTDGSKITKQNRQTHDEEKSRTGFETWVNKKHEEEIQRISRNIQREQRNRQKKESILVG